MPGDGGPAGARLFCEAPGETLPGSGPTLRCPGCRFFRKKGVGRMKGRVSVILPTYNCEHYLPGAIDSIRAQRWPDLEIIVVDDGSTDGTQEALRKLEGPDLRTLRQENQGPAAARNRGIEAADAEWIAFQDADDLWLPGKLEIQMRALAASPACGFSFTDSLARESDGAEWIQRPLRSGGDILGILLLGPQFAAGTVVARRELFERVGLFDTTLRTAEDWDMWLRLAAVSPGLHVPQVLNLFRVSDDRGKYPMDLFARANLQVLGRIFSAEGAARYRPDILPSRRRIYAWHYAVLAKSNLRSGRLHASLHCAIDSIRSHPAGIYYLTRRWRQRKDWPRLLQN
jgi:glycosyltransferase involved in cell wall biosynthesis